MHGLRQSKMGPMHVPGVFWLNKGVTIDVIDTQCVVCLFVRVGRRFTRTVATFAIFTLQNLYLSFRYRLLHYFVYKSIYSCYHFHYICNALCVCVGLCVSVCVCVYYT